MNKGFFIVFEGPDGSGKSSLSKLFKQYLDKKNIANILTREPGGNKVELSEAIRSLVLDNEHIAISYLAEAYLFAASRAQHIKQLIQPHLLNNEIVICDRFLLSSLAYQGYVRNLGIENIYNLNQLAIDHTFPNLVFYLKIDYKQAINRIKINNREQNRLDKDLNINQKVIDGYEKAMRIYNNQTYVILDATKSLDDLLNDTINAFEKYYYN